MPLHLRSSKEDDVVVVQVDGELDIATAADLWSHLSRWIEAGEIQILIDCAALTFLDCSGITTLVRCLRMVRALGGWMRLCQVSTRVLELLTITGLASVFLDEHEMREAIAGGD